MMKDWIEQNIDPPGNGRKNWRSVFSFIGRVFGIVEDDAVKAHNAFFPYLADPEKLQEHGESLKIPHLPFDSEDEYRERVTTASFYLMRAGERAYIHEQLQAHFGDKYLLKEEFLQVFIKIADLSDADLAWVQSFLDGILDPNISLSFAEWFRYIDKLLITDKFTKTVVNKNDIDSFNDKSYFLYRNGRILRGGTVLDTELHYIYRDGTAVRDGTLKRGANRVPATGRVRLPPRRGGGSRDELALICKNDFSDTMSARHYRNGTLKRDGTIRRAGPIKDTFNAGVENNFVDTIPLDDTFDAGLRIYYLRNGRHKRDGSIRRGEIDFIPLE